MPEATLDRSWPDLPVQQWMIPNGHDWLLPLKRVAGPALDPSRRPVLLLSGYGMNDYVFGFHPAGRSMIRCLVDAGYEVWTAGLRRQRGSRRERRSAPGPSMSAFAREDLPAVLREVQLRTRTARADVDLVGASLGGSVIYAHLALCPATPVGSVIALGAPLRWTTAHPALRAAFRSRRIAAAVPMAGTDRLARLAFPLVARIPGALSIYMNTDHVDLADAAALTKVVDDPDRSVNREIAAWLRTTDLVIDGINVTRALAAVDRPLLLILANADGIVPAETALAATEAWGGTDVTVRTVGTPDDWYAHADLFIAPEAPERVFQPMADWLAAR